LAAALALGASGVQMGTRFICAAECTVHHNYQKAILRAKDRDTVLTGFPGHEVRVLRNKLTRQFEELRNTQTSLEEYEKLGEGRLRQAAIEGDIEYGSVMAGQIAAMVHQIQPAASIIEDVVQGAGEVLRTLSMNYLSKEL
ncbi:MAG TPA: enoyl-[acyl-carrier-protein] reductase FabK, partial [Clostridia bacterium]|nr:enoyl-[acyl-carrier-protein] reductase FabK [Clostridia bacterium]